MERKNLSTNILGIIAIAIFVISILTGGCDKKDIEPEKNPNDSIIGPDSSNIELREIYIPNIYKDMDFNNSSSQWYFGRSKQSDHFIVFWEDGYGDNNPGSKEVPAAYQVDIDDLLEKAEIFYDINVNKLKFAKTGVGESNLDNYKMMIFLYYTTDWMSYGSGYDDVISAIWQSPNSCQPVGATIAHEIGHGFQYQVYCDLGGTSGYRYGFGANGSGGNGFWEQCAQWQAYQSYPEEAFSSQNFTVYSNNHHRHICHEKQRYASYWMHYYWADKHGIDIVGKLWRMAVKPEDPIETYMRITNISVDEFNAEVYEAATKFATWDIDAIRDIGANYMDRLSYKCTTLKDGSLQVSYDRCPGTTGFNIIPLNVPEAGTEVSAEFFGLVNEPGFNTIDDVNRAGWRYGYVALLSDGTRNYSQMYKSSSSPATFTTPENCAKLWFVVTGAPNTYAPHPWDDNDSNDDQWPYKVKFTNTNLYGTIIFDGTETPKDTTLTYNVSFPFSATNYPGTSVSIDVVALANAFVLQPSEITSAMDNSIKFYAIESNGSLNATTTANGYGHWFDANGNVIGWGNDAQVFSEYNASNHVFSIGQYPGHCASGETYTIKQALVYEYETGKTVQASIVFNITIE